MSTYGLTAKDAYQSENQATRSEELPADFRDGIVLRHRFEEVFKTSDAFRDSKSDCLSHHTQKDLRLYKLP